MEMPTEKTGHPPVLRIPGIRECVKLMEQYGMLDNIRRHSLVVARVSAAIIKGLQDADRASPLPDLRLAISGSLLHDIAKTPCLGERCNHARIGAEICRQHGFDHLAPIVEEHVILRQHDPRRYRQGHFLTREIVYYADKRVRHHEIVGLEERLAYILEHYGRDDPHRHRLIRENFAQCVELEDQLFRFLDFSPAELGRQVAGLDLAVPGA